MSRKYVTRDKNHADIVRELEKRGVQTLDLAATGSGVCDIVTNFRRRTVFIEIKFGKDPRVKKTQLHFLGTWRDACGIATNIDEAYALATDPDAHSLTDAQKNRLLAYHHLMTEKEVRLNVIMRLIGK